MNKSTTIVYLLVVAILPFFTGCQNPQQDKKIEQLKEENRQLKRERAQKEQNLYNLSETINFIEANLDTIKRQEKIISTVAMNDIENQSAAKEKIAQDITTIYNKLIQNRRKLSKLQRSMTNSGQQNESLKKMIDRMNDQMEEKIMEIENLRTNLEKMQGKITNLEGLVDTLQSLRQQQQAIISYQQQEMNTVYYAYGTSKELKQNNVITKEGGLLGIGKTRKLKDDLNKDYFTEVNKFELKTITLNARKIRIVTPHPTDSYKVYGKKPVDSLQITNPAKFWSNSQYLVIEIK